MKFRDVWHEIAKQNSILKVFLAVVVFLCFFLAVIALKSIDKPPLLIERSCETSIIDTSPQKHTIKEIDTFLQKALSERFDTEVETTSKYFTEKEVALRLAEFTALRDKGVGQYIRIREIQQKGNQAQVTADRVLAFKEIRAATAIELVVFFAKIDRTEKNPYGLILTSIKLVEKNSENN